MYNYIHIYIYIYIYFKAAEEAFWQDLLQPEAREAPAASAAAVAATGPWHGPTPVPTAFLPPSPGLREGLLREQLQATQAAGAAAAAAGDTTPARGAAAAVSAGARPDATVQATPAGDGTATAGEEAAASTVGTAAADGAQSAGDSVPRKPKRAREELAGGLLEG